MLKGNYTYNVRKRSLFHFFIGLLPRFRQYLKYGLARYIAHKRGAIIGENTVLPISLAKKANKNLIVGHNTSIQTDKIDLRSTVTIGNY
jgi:hypothetical protein